jgi:uncharacterized protein YebE (UPF0316 family)
MPISVAMTFFLIVVARITDVTLDTVRTASIIQGRRVFAALLGFFESVVYISVVAKVLLNMNHPVYAIAYGVGFASGTYLGIAVEQHLAFGDQVVSLFTRNGLTLSKALTEAGYRVAEVDAHVRDGDLAILMVEIARKHARSLLRNITTLDPSCFCVINDVRLAKWLGASLSPRPMSSAHATALAHLKR